MKKRLTVAAACAMLILIGSGAFAVMNSARIIDPQDKDGLEAQAFAADKGLWAVKALLRDAPNLSELVVDSSEIDTLQVGDGFQVHRVNLDKLKQGGSVKQVLFPTPEWRFAVLSKGKTVGLMLIKQNNEAFKFIGYAVTPKDPLTAYKFAESEIGKQGRRVTHARYVDTDEGDFIALGDDFGEWLVPVVQPITDLNEYKADDVLKKLKPSE